MARGCARSCFSERITLDDWGYPIIDRKPIPPHLEDHERRACAASPTLPRSRARARGSRSQVATLGFSASPPCAPSEYRPGWGQTRATRAGLGPHRIHAIPHAGRRDGRTLGRCTGRSAAQQAAVGSGLRPMSGEPRGRVQVATTERDTKSTTLTVPASRLLTYQGLFAVTARMPSRAARDRSARTR